MNKVRITAIRQTVYPDLMAQFENPIEHTCEVREGQQWISIDGQCPEGLCPSAWSSMRDFVESLAKGLPCDHGEVLLEALGRKVESLCGVRPAEEDLAIVQLV